MARLLPSVVATLALVVLAGAATEPVSSGQEGTLDQCQVVLGSVALGDGTFERDTDFSAYMEDGWWSVPLNSILNSTGDVLYVVPASKSESYATLTLSNRKSAGYCYSTETLLPQYNPLAVTIPSDANGSTTIVSVGSLSTVMVFGTAFGLTDFTMNLAFGIDPSIDISSYNYIYEYQTNPGGPAGVFWKESTKVDNLVTIGTTLLSNATDAYSSFAVLIYQALGRRALNASSTVWNAHGLSNLTDAALDLNDNAVVNTLLYDAAAHVAATKDYLLPSQMSQLSGEQYWAAATAIANLNINIDSAEDSSSFAKSLYYTQESVVPMVQDLVEGSVSPTEFMSTTTTDQLGSSVDGVTLPSTVLTPTTGTGSQFGSSTQAANTNSGSSGGSGMSGGAIAGTVIGVVVGVALIALAAVFLIRRSGKPILQRHQEVSDA